MRGAIRPSAWSDSPQCVERFASAPQTKNLTTLPGKCGSRLNSCSECVSRRLPMTLAWDVLWILIDRPFSVNAGGRAGAQDAVTMTLGRLSIGQPYLFSVVGERRPKHSGGDDRHANATQQRHARCLPHEHGGSPWAVRDRHRHRRRRDTRHRPHGGVGGQPHSNAFQTEPSPNLPPACLPSSALPAGACSRGVCRSHPDTRPERVFAFTSSAQAMLP